ncbi:ERCC4 domain-containing protein [Luteimonas sp. MHLX1A]|uniref:ERCC4 domain-containing protein n=1 Tax=Alterluteimonas muca TaxID=2878684 RepID=UPI001E35389B|nr:ERCC4 domain-containing protein [Luteimonas sp. MHLX1A]MCD9046796.1 hypothetical protein [Luteimonas sp. MHLX1A]
MKLTHWAKAGRDRIYVSGAAAGGDAAYVEVRRGRLHADVDGMPSPALLAEVLAHCGIERGQSDAVTYEALRACATARSRGASSSSARPAVSNSYTGAMAKGRDLAFENITNIEPVEIEVDHREPVEIDALLARAPNTRVTRTHLALGDYRVNGHLVFERKTTRDFALSVQSSHLFDQAQRMGFEPGILGVVIIEGDVFGAPTGMLHSQIIGAISCLANVQGMSVFQTTSLEHTAYVLAKFAQHDRNGLGYNLTLRTRKPTAVLDAQRYVLEGLPGINTAMADRLLQRFGTVRGVLNASVEELRQVHGMGPKRAAALHAMLTAPAAETLPLPA